MSIVFDHYNLALEDSVNHLAVFFHDYLLSFSYYDGILIIEFPECFSSFNDLSNIIQCIEVQNLKIMYATRIFLKFNCVNLIKESAEEENDYLMKILNPLKNVKINIDINESDVEFKLEGEWNK